MTTHTGSGYPNGGAPPPPRSRDERLAAVETKVDALNDKVEDLRDDLRMQREQHDELRGVVMRVDGALGQISSYLHDLAADTRDSLAETGKHAAVTAEKAAEAIVLRDRAEHGKWLSHLLAEKGLAVLVASMGGFIMILLGVCGFFLARALGH